jgi:hypothetical protein
MMLLSQRRKTITVFSSYASLILAHPVIELSEPSYTLLLSSNNATIVLANGTIPLSDGLKGVEISLSIISVIIVALTYIVLIRRAGNLINVSKLPLAPIGKNISAILAATWPDNTDGPHVLPHENERHLNNIRLLYLGALSSEPVEHRVAKGLDECRATLKKEIRGRHLWVTSGSVTTKAVVQLAIWEWVSFWLMCTTVATTVIFNGFTIGVLGNDSIPRLVVIMIYAVCYLIHVCLVWSSVLHFLTQVGAGAAWSLLHWARFAVVDRCHLFDYIKDENSPLNFTEIEKSSAGSDFIPMTYEAVLPGLPDRPPVIQPSTNERKELEAAMKSIKHDQEKARSSFQTAAESALERVIANAAAMLSICVVTGFSAYTTKPLLDNSSTQIGSIALLGSALLGLAAMFTSTLHLSNMNTAYQQILSMKELKINGNAVEYVTRRIYQGRIVGFTQGSLQARKVTLWHLLRAMNWWSRIHSLMFGPAYALLPTADDDTRHLRDTSFECKIDVRGQDVVFTTACTSRHRTHQSTGENVDAIVVYCLYSHTRLAALRRQNRQRADSALDSREPLESISEDVELNQIGGVEEDEE